MKLSPDKTGVKKSMRVATILTGVTSCAAFMPAATAHATTHERNQADQYPIITANQYLVNQFNHECLDGRLGKSNVTMQPCGNDSLHEWWSLLVYYSHDVWRNEFNGECLDGRLGTGNVTLQPCGDDGSHEWWEPQFTTAGYDRWQNEFNAECLDGRLGKGNVTLQPYGDDSAHESWSYTNA
jgi:uncharacterized short protein YbdD (DUF466 family)